MESGKLKPQQLVAASSHMKQSQMLDLYSVTLFAAFSFVSNCFFSQIVSPPPHALLCFPLPPFRCFTCFFIWNWPVRFFHFSARSPVSFKTSRVNSVLSRLMPWLVRYLNQTDYITGFWSNPSNPSVRANFNNIVKKTHDQTTQAE